MRKFYDAHCHMMNLSHPNLSVMIKRVFNEIRAIDKIKICLGTFLFAIPFLGKKVVLSSKFDDNAMNLLAVMETELGDCIVQMEEELRAKNPKWNGIVVSDGDKKELYDKIVLTPLIMDFGLRNHDKSATHYKIRWKPIVSQILDIYLGIKHYYEYRDRHPLPGADPTVPLFEIYPFMGINTKNYEMKKNSWESVDLETLLDKNFNGFEHDTVQSRYEKLSAHNWRDFVWDMDNIKPYTFMGIKVYPPLGYNPWPTESFEATPKKDMDKVKFLYSFCQTHNIPITAHCSDGGFLVDKKFANLSHPDKWSKVLATYPDLRLNLAHFGGDNKKWQRSVADLILKHKNVYTDISYRGVDKKYYDNLRKLLDSYSSDEREKLMERIIFGSDFMINLMAIESYSKYLQYFTDTLAFSATEKDMLCSKNAEKFLFIG